MFISKQHYPQKDFFFLNETYTKDILHKIVCVNKRT